MNQNSYAGRQYLFEIGKANINIDVISIGNYPEFNNLEESRCGGLWRPPTIEILNSLYSFNNFRFESLNSDKFITFLNDKKYDLAIQGGTGILKKNVFDMFKNGILNFHPGDLPSYRGCSAPEWQLFENKPIISTCHLIDEEIDTGPILKKKKLNVNMKSYEFFRASIYPETAMFVSEVVQDINTGKQEMKYKIQNEKTAVYRKYFGDTSILELKKCFF